MIFLYSSSAGKEEIILEKTSENFIYLSKVKRSREGEEIILSNLEDQKLYTYIFKKISKKAIFLTKTKNTEYQKKNTQQEDISIQSQNLHIFWGICEPKTIYKTLPFLNEMGVSSLTFIACERTQGNFFKEISSQKGKEKIQKILEQSCQQSGRNNRMKISIEKFSLGIFPKDICICDFPAAKFFSERESKNVILPSFFIGPEGGFSQAEKDFFNSHFPNNIFQFSGNSVLKSETAVIGIAGKLLL